MSTQLLTNPTAKPPEPLPPDPPRITEEEAAIQKAEAVIEGKDAELATKDAKIKALESELASVKDEVKARANEKREKPSHKHEEPSGWQTFEATAYTAYCAEGCTGTTATGLDVSHTIYHAGKRIIAVDPSVIALGSAVEVRQADGTTFEAVAQDVGGAIKGAKVDVLVANEADAVQFGRQSVQVRVIN
ncbi:3D domain-containing protein [Bacillus amyloliquefaciens]|uniref:3D domain-containing protein n=1 Tax=Bacillus amyloliquefaciens TaxID=1390 RepID=UPI00266F743C|nr:3D domain-containing protein [Bacillus amyloliquefaciens]WKT37460.1 3D domain-containing protein [Bacillus amyloliquefaciens]WKT37551.1 3D domain-containing protein [Bacillus amyloliquefaciens]